MKAISTCPSCGGNHIQKVRRNWHGEYQGQKYSVENLEFHECPDCGEKVYDREAMRAIEMHSPAFVKSSTSVE
ncbi:MAG TPA: YgiT-type zinc finger protein [Thermoguttaceae bacterium]